MEIRMKSSNFVFFLVAIGFASSFGEKDPIENENSTNIPSGRIPTETEKTDSESKSMERSFRGRQRQPEHLRTPDDKLIIDPRLYYPQFVNEGSVIPNLGFSTDGNRRKNVYLSDPTGKYNIELQNLQQGKPTNFQAALGVISAHIVNQKNNQEYIPYPPNGDPYNYPAYRGHPRATEPPVVRAYERTSNANYDVQTADFDLQRPKGLYSSDDYQSGFSNRFQNFGFHIDSDFYNDPAFYSDMRRNSYPIQEFRLYDQGEYRRPIK